MIPMLFANMFGLPSWALLVMALVGWFLFTSNQAGKQRQATGRRRFIAMPGEPPKTTHSEAVAGLDCVLKRMAEVGETPAECDRVFAEIVPKLLARREV